MCVRNATNFVLNLVVNKRLSNIGIYFILVT